MASKVRDEITCPFPNLEMDKLFHPTGLDVVILTAARQN